MSAGTARQTLRRHAPSRRGLATNSPDPFGQIIGLTWQLGADHKNAFLTTTRGSLTADMTDAVPSINNNCAWVAATRIGRTDGNQMSWPTFPPLTKKGVDIRLAVASPVKLRPVEQMTVFGFGAVTTKIYGIARSLSNSIRPPYVDH
jgi:hypothetical protein